jgi:hypothetical protein
MFGKAFAVSAIAAVSFTTSGALAQPGADFQDRGVRDEMGFDNWHAWSDRYPYAAAYYGYGGLQNRVRGDFYRSSSYRSYGGLLRATAPLYAGQY